MENIYTTTSIIVFITTLIMLLIWLRDISAVNKAINVLRSNNNFGNLIACLNNPVALDNLRNTLGITRNNLIFEVISAISKSDGEKRDGQLIEKMFKDSFNRLRVPTIILSVLTVVLSCCIRNEEMFLVTVLLFVCILLTKIKADGVSSKAMMEIVKIYIPTLCQINNVRHNETMSKFNSISAKLDTQISNLKKCSENTEKSQNFNEKANQNLENIAGKLQEIYDFSVEESKKSPFAALDTLNSSVNEFKEITSENTKNYNKNMSLYKSCTESIGDIGKVQKEVAKMSIATVKSVTEFSDTYSGIAKDIKTVMETQLGEFVGDSKLSFTNLNAMSTEIYEKMKDIFAQHVELSNKMCRTTEDGLAQINIMAKNLHDKTITTLETMEKNNENVEKAVVALCAANYKLVEVLENSSDSHETTSSMKSFLGEGKVDIVEYFKIVAKDIDELSAKVDKALEKKAKGDE